MHLLTTLSALLALTTLAIAAPVPEAEYHAEFVTPLTRTATITNTVYHPAETGLAIEPQIEIEVTYTTETLQVTITRTEIMQPTAQLHLERSLWYDDDIWLN